MFHSVWDLFFQRYPPREHENIPQKGDLFDTKIKNPPFGELTEVDIKDTFILSKLNNQTLVINVREERIMETQKSGKKKCILRGMAVGMLCILGMFITSTNLVAQTIEFKGGTCTSDTYVEVPGGSYKFVRAGFLYKLDEDASVSALGILMTKGVFKVSGRKYKPTSYVLDMGADGEIPKEGKISLLINVPDKLDVSKLKFVLNKKEVSFTKENKD